MNINDLESSFQEVLDNPDTCKNPGALIGKMNSLKVALSSTFSKVKTTEDVDQVVEMMEGVYKQVYSRLLDTAKESGVSPVEFMKLLNDPKNLSLDSHTVIQDLNRGIGKNAQTGMQDKRISPQKVVSKSLRTKHKRSKQQWAVV